MNLILAIGTTLCAYFWTGVVYCSLENKLKEFKVNYAKRRGEFLVQFIAGVLILNFAVPYMLVRLAISLWLKPL